MPVNARTKDGRHHRRGRKANRRKAQHDREVRERGRPCGSRSISGPAKDRPRHQDRGHEQNAVQQPLRRHHAQRVNGRAPRNEVPHARHQLGNERLHLATQLQFFKWLDGPELGAPQQRREPRRHPKRDPRAHESGERQRRIARGRGYKREQRPYAHHQAPPPSVPRVGSTEFAANSSLAGTTCGMPAVSAASKNRFTESANSAKT